MLLVWYRGERFSLCRRPVLPQNCSLTLCVLLSAPSLVTCLLPDFSHLAWCVCVAHTGAHRLRSLGCPQAQIPLSSITAVCLLNLPDAHRACSGHSALRNPLHEVWLHLVIHLQHPECGWVLPCLPQLWTACGFHPGSHYWDWQSLGDESLVSCVTDRWEGQCV